MRLSLFQCLLGVGLLHIMKIIHALSCMSNSFPNILFIYDLFCVEAQILTFGMSKIYFENLYSDHFHIKDHIPIIIPTEEGSSCQLLYPLGKVPYTSYYTLERVSYTSYYIHWRGFLMPVIIPTRKGSIYPSILRYTPNPLLFTSRS